MRTIKSEFARLGLLQTRRREVTTKSSKAKDKPKERLTERDFKELMGQYRDTYKRKNGAIRRK